MSFRPVTATPPRTSEYAPAEVATTSSAPTLRVMRLQKPELHVSAASIMSPLCHDSDFLLYESNSCALQTALCLPDSLTVFVGETFTAYLGVLPSSPLRRLTVVAQLQTPTQRYPLPSRLETAQDVVIAGVDAIVSRTMEEAGPHILRVEVSYQGTDGATASFRKFYRFQVRAPLLLLPDSVVRTSDTTALVRILMECDKENAAPIYVASLHWEAAPGLEATSLGPSSTTALDDTSLLRPGGRVALLFSIQATAPDARLRGMAGGDALGRLAVTWRQAMGEHGTLYSPSLLCPPFDPQADVVRSGRAVDIAAAAAAANDGRFHLTVEPMDPPKRLALHVPVSVPLLVVNHTHETLTVQLQFPALHSHPDGIVIEGPSVVTLGAVAGAGGSVATAMRFVPLRAGLVRIPGPTLVDVATGRAAPQPPLWSAVVE